MSDLQKYVDNRKKQDVEFADGYDVGYEAFKFGALIKELRLKNGMTQEDLAPVYQSVNVRLSPRAFETFINVSILQFIPFSIFDNCC